MPSVQMASGMPKRTRRSRAYLLGPLRSTDPGVTNPEIKKNSPIANSAAGSTGIANITLLTAPRLTSWTSW